MSPKILDESSIHMPMIKSNKVQYMMFVCSKIWICGTISYVRVSAVNINIMQ